MKGIKGYKVFNPDWTCLGFKYEVGKIYEENVTPSVRNKGFHFCKRAVDCFNYYKFDPNNKVAEVIALGEIAEEGDKCCTNKIKIVREISWKEVLDIVNTGKENSGLCNTGDKNTGDCNTGNRNTGDWNAGDKNTGHCNTGNKNAGNRNTGDCNIGNRNTGNCNIGNRNTGDCNQGDFCTGDFNIVDYETGCFCTEEHKIRFFDKESDMTFLEWRNSEAYRILCRVSFEPARWIRSDDMTDEEKTAHPEYETTGGYLKIRNISDCFKEWWEGLTEHEKQVIKNIPNFDADKFELITGIKVV